MFSIWDVRWRNRMDFVGDAVELGIVCGVLPEVPPKDYVERKKLTVVNFRETNWYRLFRRLEDGLGDFDNDLSKDGVRFRGRFRLPFSKFFDIYTQVRDEEWFGEGKKSKRVPNLFLKIMGVFRLLGRNLVYDDVAEISSISETTIRKFYGKFTDDFSRYHYDNWMRQPRHVDQIAANERVYRSNGWDFAHMMFLFLSERRFKQALWLLQFV